MQKKAGFVFTVILAAAAVVVLAGCFIPYVRTSPGPAKPAPGPAKPAPGPAPSAPLYRNGQMLVVTGTVVVNGAQVMMQDVNGPATFRFVGLQKATEKALTGIEGRVTKVRLRVVSAESARVYRAQFIEFVPRQ